MLEKKHPFHQFQFCPKCGANAFIENNVKSKRCESCNFVYYFNPSSATVAVIVNNRKELLVATRANNPAKGTLDLPGGFVDMNETGEEAVIREVYEESGLTVKSVEYLFSIPNTYIYSDFEVQTTDMFFLCNIDENEPFEANDDVAKLQFIPISKLDSSLFGLASIRKGIEKIKASLLKE